MQLLFMQTANYETQSVPWTMLERHALWTACIILEPVSDLSFNLKLNQSHCFHPHPVHAGSCGMVRSTACGAVLLTIRSNPRPRLNLGYQHMSVVALLLDGFILGCFLLCVCGLMQPAACWQALSS